MTICVEQQSIRKIITSGFSFSGSSAILDYLISHKGVAKFPGGEFRLINGRAIRHVLLDIKQNGAAQTTTIESLDRFLSAEFSCKTQGEKSVRANISAIIAAFGDEYFHEKNVIIDALINHPSDGDLFAKSLQNFINRMCVQHAKSVDADTIVIDQAVRPWRMGPLRYFDDYHVIISQRDIRDQIIDRLRHGVSDSGFAAEMMKRTSGMSRGISKYGKDNFTVTWFEDFVTQSRERGRILTAAGLNHRRRTSDKFNPVASRNNIKLHIGRECPGSTRLRQNWLSC